MSNRTMNAVRVCFLGAAIAFLLMPGAARGQCEAIQRLQSDGEGIGEFSPDVAIHGDLAVFGGRGVAYVHRFDGAAWVREARLVGPADRHVDEYAHSLAVHDELVIVGAPWDDEAAPEAGAAYVYRFDGASWIEETKLRASDAEYYDSFGWSVAVGDDVALVGSWWDDDACPQDPECNSGSVYVFRCDGASWIEDVKLTASDAAKDAVFGISVAMSDDVAIIGAPDHMLQSPGAAYIFRFDGASWTEEIKLIASDGAAGDEFGYAVAIDDDVAVALAKVYIGRDRHHAAYVFRHDGAAWIEEARLTLPSYEILAWPTNTVDVSGDLVAIGAYDGGVVFGQPHLWRYNSSTSQWLDAGELLPAPGSSDFSFGISAALSGDRGIIGAMWAPPNAYFGAAAHLFDLTDCLPCPADVNVDGTVDVLDLLAVLAAWGATGGPEDINGDGMVDVLDLLEVLAAWGPC